MKIEIHKCPECGMPPVGTVEKVVARFEERDDSDEDLGENEFDYSGDTDLDTQETIVNDKEESLVTCENGHDWFTKITEE